MWKWLQGRNAFYSKLDQIGQRCGDIPWTDPLDASIAYRPRMNRRVPCLSHSLSGETRNVCATWRELRIPAAYLGEFGLAILRLSVQLHTLICSCSRPSNGPQLNNVADPDRGPNLRGPSSVGKLLRKFLSIKHRKHPKLGAHTVSRSSGSCAEKMPIPRNAKHCGLTALHLNK
jgi:hypothetical protein